VRTLIIHLADDEAGHTRWLQDALAIKLYTKLLTTLDLQSINNMSAPPRLLQL
jgi:hypothetical protein